jgi:protein gp37
MLNSKLRCVDGMKNEAHYRFENKMSEKTAIAWTDSTHNFWRGCTKISPGCANCYAEKLVTTRLQGEWGKGKPRVRLKDFDRPIGWNKKPWICNDCVEAFPDGQIQIHRHGNKEGQFHRRRVFSLSLGDIGDAEVPIELFNEAMIIVDKCRNLTWQLLTKRPADFQARWNEVCYHWGRTNWGRTNISLPANVWMGVSVENQARADELIPQLLDIPAKIRFLSIEPMLEEIDLEQYWPKIDWVIFGGETGPNARPCNIEWIRDGIRQCQSHGVPIFVKQVGSNHIVPNIDRLFIAEHFRTFSDKKGGDMAEWPEDMRIRQFPQQS